MEKNKLGHLCYLMLHNDKGVALLDELKRMLGDDPIFPKPKEVLEQFGGASMFAAYRAGQMSLIKFIELHGKGYKDQEHAMQAKQDKEAK
jgi:hypothetical protein